MRSGLSCTAFAMLIVSTLVSISCKSTRGSDGSEPSKSELQGVTSNDVFRDTDQKMFDMAVHELTLHVDGDTFLQMTNLPAQGGFSCLDDVPYGHVKEFIFKNGRTGETVKINNIGMRVKGNTTCDDPIEQRGFKFKMNPVDKVDSNGKTTMKVYEKFRSPLNYPQSLAASVKGQSLFGMDEFGVRRSGVDPSKIRDLLASDVFEYGGELARRRNSPGAPTKGGPVYRGSVAYLKVHNGFGVLTEGHAALVEMVDGDLIKSHYGKEALGHLFKIKEAKGTFLDSDMPSGDLNRLLKVYEPKVVDGKDFEGDDPTKKRASEILLGFKKLLNEAVSSNDVNERRKKLAEFLDIENILSYVVSVNLVGHWDSLVGANSNNDFIFLNEKTKKWGVLTWDLDNTFGAGNSDRLWMAGIKEFNVPLKYRPLFKAVLDNYSVEYKERFKEYLGGVFGFKQMNDRITAYRNLITGGANDDRYELIYKFYGHRFGNAWCQVFKGENFYTRVENGYAKVSQDGLNVECEKKN